MTTDTRTPAEKDFHRHIGMFGSAAYPIQKVSGGRWMWVEFWGVKGAPTMYRTKKAAAQAIENYIDILCDKASGRLS